jgi:hypothetical protein
MRNRNLVQFTVAIVLLCGTSPYSSARHAPCGGPKGEQRLKSELTATAKSVMKLVSSGEHGKFLQFASRRGIGFGADVPLTSRRVLAEQFRAKSGYYCLLFSSRCLSEARKAWPQETQLSQFRVSYRDWLSSAGSLRFESELLDESEICGGLVIIRSSSETTPTKLELEFIREDGKWKLVNTPYSLGN